ncbi:MAG: hypothetical protein GWM92_01375, partial [Gemmatimonadetes bacterium]|nr:hypothetical protein [Gemmatimonadota bacterium]NIR77117.1 hypothetical protein [Gemmatimonadota bacterium]NIT85635.1 hypothetical protein [Gemmatimonadota bacterium]NIU29467.1 hypothetical protein [Gemmatimonadota bacterium]NIU34530.1 hypothetical protein [Gemmatimonadota bacterium]
HYAAGRFEEEGGVVLWVDVATVSNFAEIARRLISSVPYSWIWREDLQARLIRASIQVELRADAAGNPSMSLSLEPRPTAPEHGKEEVRRAVGVLDSVAGDRDVRIAVVLDEFQEIAGLADGAEWILRELMQNAHHLSFVCAGSRASLIEDLLSGDGAFHRFFEPLNVREIDPGHLGGWIEDRMGSAGVSPEAGVGEAIIALVGPRTQDCLQLARAVFVHGQSGGSVSSGDVRRALRSSVLEDADRFETLWAGLARSQQAVLRAVAAGEQHLYSRDAARRHGLPTSGTIRKAILALQEKRHLSEGEELRIDDPYFREWILLRAMPDGVPYVPGSRSAPEG